MRNMRRSWSRAPLSISTLEMPTPGSQTDYSSTIPLVDMQAGNATQIHHVNASNSGRNMRAYVVAGEAFQQASGFTRPSSERARFLFEM